MNNDNQEVVKDTSPIRALVTTLGRGHFIQVADSLRRAGVSADQSVKQTTDVYKSVMENRRNRA